MVSVGKRGIGWLGLLLGLLVAAGILVGTLWLVRGLLGFGKPGAVAILRVAMEEKPIAFPVDGGLQTHRDRFEIYKSTQQQLFVSRFVLLAALRDPALARLPTIRRVQEKHDAVDWLGKHLRVHFPGNGELMEVSIALDDPQESVTLLQGVVDAYLREVVNMESDQRRVRLSELDRAVAEKEADVLRDHEELIKMAAVLGTSETGTLTPKQKLALADLESARRELSGMKSELRHLKTDLASQKALLQDTDIFKKLREEVKAEKLATIQAEVKRLEAAIAATTADQQSLQQEVQRIRKSAESFGRVTANMKLIQSTLKNAEAALASLSTERDKVRVECRRPVRIQLFVPAHSAPPSPPNPKCPTEKK